MDVDAYSYAQRGAWDRLDYLAGRRKLTGAEADELVGVTDDNDWLTAPGGEFETYYSEHPHDAFAAQVWTNNAWVTAMVLFTGVLILPAVYLLFGNALNTAVTGGLMADAGRLDSF